MGSLSEGQKHKESSSGSELGDIDIDDDDEEERIIEMRRKKREELMKVNLNGQLYRCVSSSDPMASKTLSVPWNYVFA